MIGGVYMNLEFFNSLPADYQALLMDIWENDLDDLQY